MGGILSKCLDGDETSVSNASSIQPSQNSVTANPLSVQATSNSGITNTPSQSPKTTAAQNAFTITLTTAGSGNQRGVFKR